MLELAYILAQRRSDDGDDWIKFLFGALVVGFWIISSIASALNKKHEKERRERVRQQLEHPELPTAPKPSPRRQPAELAPQVAMRIPAPAKPRHPPRTVKRAQPIKHRTVPPRPPAVPSRQVAQASVAHSIVVAPAPLAPAIVKPQPAGATAVSIRRWLNPITLRQQFVLTEILQPPKALREPGT